MTREEIFEKVKEVLVDALAADDDEVTAEATLEGDLGAESIDYLDIRFKLEQEFDFKIADGELFPDDVGRNSEFVQDGKVTATGIAAMKEKLPHIDFTAFEANPEVGKVSELFTVDTLVSFVENKLAG